MREAIGRGTKVLAVSAALFSMHGGEQAAASTEHDKVQAMVGKLATVAISRSSSDNPRHINYSARLPHQQSLDVNAYLDTPEGSEPSAADVYGFTLNVTRQGSCKGNDPKGRMESVLNIFLNKHDGKWNASRHRVVDLAPTKRFRFEEAYAERFVTTHTGEYGPVDQDLEQTTRDPAKAFELIKEISHDARAVVVGGQAVKLSKGVESDFAKRDCTWERRQSAEEIAGLNKRLAARR